MTASQHVSNMSPESLQMWLFALQDGRTAGSSCQLHELQLEAMGSYVDLTVVAA